MQMRRLGIGLVMLIASTASYADCRNTTPGQIQEDKARALQAPSVQAVEEEGHLRLRIPQPNGEEIINYFTLPEHPAHPSHVVSAIYESGGKMWLYSRGVTAGNCVAFKAWMAVFATQHEKIQSQVQAKLGDK